MDSPLNYLGGKSRLAKHIVPMIPVDHACYCEPFCGAAWILFRKPSTLLFSTLIGSFRVSGGFPPGFRRVPAGVSGGFPPGFRRVPAGFSGGVRLSSRSPSRHEVINDIDAELVNFWRILQNHLQPFLEYFKYAVISRKLFNLENSRDPSTLTDLQRAVRYYYLQRTGFGGKPTSRTFGTSATGPANLNLLTLEESLLEVHWRLARVTIEHLDALDCIRRYDRAGTFFYLDPPYYRLSQPYAKKFEDADFIRLRDVLASISGRFILSVNDAPAIRKLFGSFRQVKIAAKYSSGNGRITAARSKPRLELLVHNLRK